MSTALAIAGVTQVLRDLLNDRIVNGNVAGVIGNSVTVSTLPPDKVVAENGIEATQLNLFLRHITPNLAWRNEGLASRSVSGSRLTNPPLALNLHYLVSAYGSQDLHSEILLGYALQMLHEHPFLTREQIRKSLQPPPDVGATLPDHLRALADTGLAEQVEQLRITPEFLSTEEMSKFWTSTLTHYRPSAAYEVSVVLIQARNPAIRALPVLVRTVGVRPQSLAAVPTLTVAVPADNQPVALIDAPITVKGVSLEGTAHQVVVTHDRFGITDDSLLTLGSADSVTFTIPASRATDFPVGIYRLSATLAPPGETTARQTNDVAFTLAPSFIGPSAPVPRSADGTAVVSLTVAPALREGQAVRLSLGLKDYPARPFVDGATVLTFDIPAATPGEHIACLRVDGINSPIIKLDGSTPEFFPYRLRIAA